MSQAILSEAALYPTWRCPLTRRGPVPVGSPNSRTMVAFGGFQYKNHSIINNQPRRHEYYMIGACPRRNLRDPRTITGARDWSGGEKAHSSIRFSWLASFPEAMFGFIVWRSRHRKVPRCYWREDEVRASRLSHVARACGVYKSPE
jgi:hypothetical protein